MNAAGSRGRRRGGGRGNNVVRSSLELVFSYSRSQQRFNGGLPSAPSFVEYNWGAQDGGETDTELDDSRPPSEYDAEQGYGSGYGSGDERNTEADTESTAGDAFFPGDPVAAARRSSAENSPLPTVDESHEESTSPTSGPSLPGKRGGILSFFSSTPPATVPLSTSISNSSSGSQTTPRPPVASRKRPSLIPPDAVESSDDGGNLSSPQARKVSIATERTPLLGPDGTRRKSWAPDRLMPPGESPQRNMSISQQRRVSRAKVAPPRGESTDGQALFNAVAVLVGIGLLSMPLAFSYAGWIWGTIMIIGFTWITCHTAKLLAKLMYSDASLEGYTDIGRKAFGGWAGNTINLLFCLELFTFGVAMVVLFGDSLNVVVPYLTPNQGKFLCFFLVLPTVFMPLRLLSVPSILSTMATVLLVGIILFDGFYKAEAPGSIREPMPTHWGPETANMNWLGGVGLILAGFGGHSVFPSIARDMKHPESADRVFNIAFYTAGAISFISGAAGYLMIGDRVSDEITREMMDPRYGYPLMINMVAVWMIVVNPLTKFALCSRPLNVAIEGFLGWAPSLAPVTPPTPPPRARRQSVVDHLASTISISVSGAGASDYLSTDDSHVPHTNLPKSPMTATYAAVDPEFLARETKKGTMRIISRTIITSLTVVAAISLPGFGRVMAFIGSFSAFLICIVLPLTFYLRLQSRIPGENEDTLSNRFMHMFHIILLIGSTILMFMGTIWSFLPTSGHHWEE
ncbi:hypothetical protein VHUM_01349 [Vanrija humicola]|uniref:Amino acid transporter transmembrane domain-containing protein n=1 Tax=Vanrija humicola TaxID=5417 RepID=A0A7D8Z180_VANHU|nr:hypothetical protein VHUM_01349 [Vanrija humicola]